MEVSSLVLILALASQQIDAFTKCGGGSNLTQQLNSASSKASKWLTDFLEREQVQNDLYIDSTAFHSLRLAGNYSTRLNSIQTDKISFKKLTGGRVALHLNGIMASCENPDKRLVRKLLKRLKHCTDTTIVKCGLTHPFQYLTAALVLCNSGRQFPNLTARYHFKPSNTVIKRIDDILNSIKYSKTVDTFAMALMTRLCLTKQICEKDEQGKSCEKAKIRNEKNIKRLIKKQSNLDGSFGGNGISTSLAVQALLAYHIPSSKWQCSKTMVYVLTQQKQDGSFGGLMPTIQILPILKGVTLLDYEQIKQGCNDLVTRQENYVAAQLTPTVTDDNTMGTRDEKNITVTLVIKVVDKFDCQYIVTVKQGSSAHDVLKAAVDQYTSTGSNEGRCDTFSFQASSTRYGAYVTSMLQYNEDKERKRHWMMYNNDGSLATIGVDDCRPENGTKVTFKFHRV